MCGRAKLETDVSEIKIAFRVPPEYPTPNFPPSWNIAPTDNLPIVRYDAKAGSRTLDLMRWGLVPYWSKDLKIGFSTINAMAETVDKKPVFREAFKRRRCLVRCRDVAFEDAAARTNPLVRCLDDSLQIGMTVPAPRGFRVVATPVIAGAAAAPFVLRGGQGRGFGASVLK